MKWVINGGNGFIGSRIIQLALQDGHQVVSMSRRPAAQFSSPSFHSIQWDQGLSKAALLDSVKGADVLIQCVASKKNGIETSILQENFNTNVFSLQNLVEFCTLNSIKRFVFLGTANAYEFKSTAPVTEESAFFPRGKDVAYLASLVAAEIVLFQLCRAESLPLLSLRLSSVYGHSPSGKGLISSICEKALRQIPIELYNLKNLSADFLWLDDIYRVIHIAVQSKIEGIYNLSSGYHTALENLIQILKPLLAKYEPQWKDQGNHDQNRIFPVIDNSKLKKDFGFVPSSLETGVGDSVLANLLFSNP